MTNIPEWVEFTFRTSDGTLYWGSVDGYQHPKQGYEHKHQIGWVESTYQHWKASTHARLVIHQLEND
ncbi:hypothetical protein [Erwinia phage Pecta]|nr:hypothetical protein [Erwinia phage Pecta]